jgi:GT2 family glycosyltransferase
MTPYGSNEASPGTPHLPKVSILIVNFNGAQWLENCLSSLLQSSYPNREIIVVDNNSTDNSLTLLQNFHPIQIIQSPTNLGFAGGNNLGLQHCSGDFILLLNNDTTVTPNFLEPLVHYLLKHPHVGIAQSKMLLPRFNNTLDVCGSFLTAFGFPYHVGYYKPDGPAYSKPYPVFSAKGACMILRRNILEHTGGFLFDDSFFCYYEETDLCHRAWLAGIETHFVPQSVIHHLHGATGGQPNRAGFVLQLYLRNQLFSLLSNLSIPSLLRILPLYATVFTASAIAATLTLRTPLLKAHLNALLHCWKHRGAIRNRRQLARQIRTAPDKQLLPRILRTPRLSYFWRSFTGSLSRYTDDPKSFTQ